MIVFVYGSLRKGFGNHRLLGNSTYLKDVSIKGMMYSLGPFPAVVLNRDGVVHCEAYEVTTETLNNLDRLEDHPNWYRREEVTSDEGIIGWVYGMPPEFITKRDTFVPSGDWKEWAQKSI